MGREEGMGEEGRENGKGGGGGRHTKNRMITNKIVIWNIL